MAATAVWMIIPAAGIGRRFRSGDAPVSNRPQDFKQLQPWGDHSMLAALLDAADLSRARGVVVVVNPAIAPAIQRERPETPRRRYVLNQRPDSQMIESIQLGLAAARGRAARDNARLGFAICPGDYPAINSSAIDRCIAAFEQQPDRIVIAAHAGRRGHPIIIPDEIGMVIAAWPSSRKLSELRTLYADRVQLIETGDPGVLHDVDTPADLRDLKNYTDSSN